MGSYCLEVVGSYCRIRIMLDVKKPLRQGIFISTEDSEKMWLAFKYENLPLFCLDCGKIGHGIVDCEVLSKEDKAKREDSLPYSFALRAESKLLGKEYIQFGFASKMSKVQCNYTGPVNKETRKNEREMTVVFLW